jgi:hypothetical protein
MINAETTADANANPKLMSDLICSNRIGRRRKEMDR